jgi:hypothetical protein
MAVDHCVDVRPCAVDLRVYESLQKNRSSDLGDEVTL